MARISLARLLLRAVGRPGEPRPGRGTQNFALDLRAHIGETTGREMRDLQLDEAAALLCVSPETLRAWERRFGYPHPVSAATGQGRYAREDVIALRDTLEAGLSVASAINKAQALGTIFQPPSPR